MHAGLLGAFKGNARAAQFCQPINIVGLDAQHVFYVMAHFLAPCLCPEYTGLELYFVFQAFFRDRFGNVGRV